MLSLLHLLIRQLRRVLADKRDLVLESLALRQQLAIYQRTGLQPKLTSADRLFWVWLSRFWQRWRQRALGRRGLLKAKPASDAAISNTVWS